MTKMASLLVAMTVGLRIYAADGDLSAWMRTRSEVRPKFPTTYVAPKGDSKTLVRNSLSFEAEEAVARQSLPDSTAARSWKRVVDAQGEILSVATIQPTSGVTWNFAVYNQLGNLVPYYWTGTGYPAASGSDLSAASVERTREILGSTVACSQMLVATNVLSKADTGISMMDGTSVVVPFERAYLVFVDDRPCANWAHPCRYVFFNEDLSEFAVSYQSYAPRIRRLSSGERLRLKVVEGAADVVPLKEITDKVYSAANAMTAGVTANQGDVSRSHFVLISGGGDPENNGIRFWADTAMLYSTFTRKYGVPKSQIHVLMSDGGDPNADANLNDFYNPVLVDSPTDLDGDGEPDVDGAATWANMNNVFTNTLAKVVTADSQVFVFIVSHGSANGTAGVNNHSCLAYLYSTAYSTAFNDYELAKMTKSLPCPVAFAIETCYSGGFIDDLTATPDRVVLTACDHYESSLGTGGQSRWGSAGAGSTCAYDTWAVALAAAVRGRWPANYDATKYVFAFPWNDGASADADANGDGLVSMEETFAFAWENDECRCTAASHTSCRTGSLKVEHPQFAESTAGLGAQFYVLKQNGGAVDEPPANDDFANAVTLVGAAGQATGSNVRATTQAGEPLPKKYTLGTNTVWWTWTAPSAGTASFSTAGTGFDTVMGVYVGDVLSSLGVIKEDDDGGASRTSVCTFDCVAGKRYYIAVAGWGNSAVGTIKLNWEFSGTGTPTATEFPYKLVNGNAIITNYTGTSGDVVFPSVIDGHPVTEIAANAFYYGTYPFVNVTISEGIRKIGHAAFGYSSQMETFSIPSTLTTLGDGDGFEFFACSKMRRIDVTAGNPNYKSVDGVLYDKSGTTLIYCPANKDSGGAFAVPGTVTTIAEYAFCSSKFKNVSLPEGLGKIADNVFCNASELVSMDVPDTVTSIGRWAFCYCYSLADVRLPSQLTTIGQYAFCDTSIGALDVPAGVSSIGQDALKGTSLTNLVLRGRVATTYASNKWGSNLDNSKVWVSAADASYWQSVFGTGFKILSSARPSAPSSLSAVSSTAVNLTWSAVPSATSYTVWRSTGDSSASATLIATVTGTSYSDGAPTVFQTCHYWVKAANSAGASDFSPPGSGYRYQANTHLLRYDANGGTGAMADQIRTTSYASDLTKNAFARSGYAFMGWSTTPTGSRVYRNGQYTQVSTTPGEIVTLYAVWSPCDADGLVVENLVVRGWSPVQGTDIVIPNGVTAIASYAFESSSLTSVKLPNSLKTLSTYAFYECDNLTNVTFGTGLTKIDMWAFCGCSSLVGTFAVPDGVTEVGFGAFMWSGVQTLVFPASLTKLGGQISLSGRLQNVWFRGNAPQTDSGVYMSASSTLVTHVPMGSTGWKDDSSALPSSWPSGSYSKAISNYTGEPPTGTCTRFAGDLPPPTDSISDFEGLDAESSVTTGTCEPTSGGNSYWLASDGNANDSMVVAFGSSDVPTGYSGACGQPLGLKSLGNRYLFLKTPLSSPLWRAVNPLVGTAVQPRTVGDVLTFDFLAILDPCDEMPSIGDVSLEPNGVPHVSNAIRRFGSVCMLDDKLSVCLLEDEFGEEVTLCVLAGARNATTGKIEERLFQYSSAGLDPESWNRVTIKAMTVDSRLRFLVYFNGELLSDDAYYARPQSGTELSISALGFAGSGCVDNIFIGEREPVFDDDDPEPILPEGVSLQTVDGIDWIYRISNGQASVGSGTYDLPAVPIGTVGDISIPAKLGGVPVTGVDDYAFQNCAKLTGVTIPASVRRIGDDAFYGCASLASAALPVGLLRIGDKAFEGCEKLTSAAIPAGVEQVGYRAFANCYALTDVTLPACLESGMMWSVFERDDETQHPCLWERVTLLGNWEMVMGFEWMTELESVTLPGSVREIGSSAFRGCTSLKSVTISGGSAQSGSGDGRIVGPGAFEGCVNLTSVSIPAGVEEIGDSAFRDCAKLAGVTIPASVRTIGADAFSGCASLASAALPVGLLRIGDKAFEGCAKLTSAAIPAGVEQVGYRAFANCYVLTDVTLPACLESGMMWSVFARDDEWLHPCLWERVTLLGDWERADGFEEMTSLVSVTLPGSVREIGSSAFRACSALRDVVFEGDAPMVGFAAFEGVNSSCTAWVKVGSTGWDVEIPGMWNNVKIAYRTDLPPVVCGPNLAATQSGDGWTISSVNGSALTDADLSSVKISATLTGGAVVDVTRGYKVVRSADGKSATLQLKTPEVGVQPEAGETEKAVDDPSGMLVEVDESELATKPSVKPGESVGALPVKAVKGLWYQASWGGDLNGLTQGEKVQATSDSLYLGVIKQTGASGFYRLSVSEK